MRSIPVKTLTLESYHGYGDFTDLLAPEGEYIGEFPVRFYRDMVRVTNASAVSGFSVVLCEKQEMIVREAEQHEKGTEVLLPLEDDVIVFAAPATDKVFPAEKAEAFLVPRGTMVTFHPGVWHKAPFPVHKEKAATLIILPEREYALDCIVEQLTEDRVFRIEY